MCRSVPSPPSLYFVPFETPEKSQPENAPLWEKLLRIDCAGSTLIVGSLICYTRALQVAGITMPWSSAQVFGLLVGAFVLFLVLCAVEKVLCDRAMIVHKLLRTRLVIVDLVYGIFFERPAFSILYAIPVFFQAVDGVFPVESGIRNVPFLLACGVRSMVAGLVFAKTRLAHPILIFACGGAAVGTGLIYTLDVSYPDCHWIGYQVLAGLAYGAGFPLGIILGQSEMGSEDVPSSTALLLMSFNVGSALTLAAAQSILDNIILNRLPTRAPTVDPYKVLSAGASGLHSTFNADVLPGIIASYLDGLRIICILYIALLGLALLAELFYPYEKLNARQ